jgi:hydrogenase-4 component B
MSAIWLALLASAVLGWLAAGATAVLGRGPLGLRLAASLSVLGGLAAVAGGVGVVATQVTLHLTIAGSLVGLVSVRVNPMSAVFVIALGLVAMAIGAYMPRYHHPGAGTGIYLLAYHGALVASLAVLAAGSITVFLVAWESMTLTSYLLILRRHRDPEVARGAFLFLALGELGFALIVGALVVLSAQAGSTSLATIAAHAPRLGAGWADAVFVMALVGFGFKAGLVPLHIWLPAAHPVAPSDGSGFLSGVVTKLGVYGFLLVTFQLLPTGPVWWGLLALGLGAVSSVLGVLYALMEHDWKRFLAYHTIENIGIIFIAVGASLTFFESRQPALGALLLIAGLYHVLNHATYKTLLFLEAGVIEHAVGLRDLDRLGGLARRMPRAAILTLLGTIGIAGLPPLNGFVSEWLVFEGLFQGFRIPSHLVGVFLVVAAAALALASGLAINAFAKAFGFSFLGMPRSSEAAAATEVGQPVAGPALLAAACCFLAVGAPIVLTGLDRVAAATTGVNILSRLIVPGLTIIPAHTNFSAFSPTYLAVCLVAMLLIPALLVRSRTRWAPDRSVPVWAGGMLRFRPRMQYTATTHANPIRVTFERLYRPQVSLSRASDDPAGRSGPVHYHFEVTPIFDRYLYQPAVRLVEWLARAAKPIQSGDVNQYLLYVFVAILLAYLLAVR